MSRVEKIKTPIRKEMELFEDKFRLAMRSRVPLLDHITHYIVNRKGKQMRPMFVFLVANLVGKVNESTYRAASTVELMHTATLVHDDVVDDSNRRRNFFSINALWKNKIAVLVGDYLLSKALLLSIDNSDFEELRIISEAVRQISEGELLQLEKARKMDITEDIYFEIIRQKTAVLIAACCSVGAKSVGANTDVVKRMWTFGELVGTAFQIKDDLFDYQDNDTIGKPTGIDIKERKITLPLIYAMNNSGKKEKNWLINSIKNHNKNKKRVNQVIEFVTKSGGIDYAVSKMNEYKDQALQILFEYPDSIHKQTLRNLVHYVIDRKR